MSTVRDPVIADVALGANLGDALQTVRQTLEALSSLPGSRLIAHSRLYRTAPHQAQGPDFINAVARLETRLTAPDLLDALQAQPWDTRSLADWASSVHTTERTLVRRCQRELGMSLVEWRQRLRVVKALPRLEAGDKIEAIAFDLGYASVSAFIAMFRRLMGVTPDAFRKGSAVATSVATHPVAAL